MTKNEAIICFQNTIKALWPNWEIYDAQVEIWVEMLMDFNYEVVKEAAHQHYRDKAGQYKTPKIHVITESCRRNQPKPDDLKRTIVFTIECIDHEKKFKIGQKKDFYSDEPNAEWIKDSAEQTRQGFERMYLGKWIVNIPQTIPF